MFNICPNVFSNPLTYILTYILYKQSSIIVPPFAYPNTKPPRLRLSTRLRVTKSLAAARALL